MSTTSQSASAKKLIEIGEHLRDLPVLREVLGTLRRARVHGRHLRIGHESRVGLEMDVGDEPGAEDGDFCGGHASCLL